MVIKDNRLKQKLELEDRVDQKKLEVEIKLGVGYHRKQDGFEMDLRDLFPNQVAKHRSKAQALDLGMTDRL